MTAINENGQVYFVFEDLDFDGAIEIIHEEIKELKKLAKGLEIADSNLIWKKIVSRSIVINRLLILRDFEYDKLKEGIFCD